MGSELMSGTIVYVICIGLPAVIGVALAGAALSQHAPDDGNTVLGNYRGLYCFIRRWEFPTTGLIVILFFCLTTSVTLLLYVMTAIKVSQVVKASGGNASSKAPKAIMKRGVFM